MKLKCLNCGHEFDGSISKDELGWHSSCPECECSFDVDIPKKINKYGAKLQSDFCAKVKIQRDIDLGIFDGTWRYEEKIETVEDAVGWMLETYDYEAYDVLNEWINDDAGNVWGLDIRLLKNELEKVFD